MYACVCARCGFRECRKEDGEKQHGAAAAAAAGSGERVREEEDKECAAKRERRVVVEKADRSCRGGWRRASSNCVGNEERQRRRRQQRRHPLRVCTHSRAWVHPRVSSLGVLFYLVPPFVLFCKLGPSNVYPRPDRIFLHKSRHHLVSFLVSFVSFRSRNLLNYLLFALYVYAQVVAKFWFGVSLLRKPVSFSFSRLLVSLYSLHAVVALSLARERPADTLSVCSFTMLPRLVRGTAAANSGAYAARAQPVRATSRIRRVLCDLQRLRSRG